MPFSVDVDPRRGLVTVRLYGVLTPEDFAKGRTALEAHPDFRPGFSQILDLGDLKRIDVDAAGLRNFAKAAPFGAGSRRAVVAPTDLLYGLARLYEISGSERDWQMGVFRTLDEARAWLEGSSVER